MATAFPAIAGTVGHAGRYLDTSEYVQTAFPAGVPAASTLWVTGELREVVERVLGHRLAALRVRYWLDDEKSVWILDEIGKELPITIGVAVNENAIADVSVLEFRESRGWEVRYPFFTDQFNEAKLDADGGLDRHIDGITGATLSVRAVTKVAKVALLMHDDVTKAQ